ncbi:hypothetical protein WEI85_17315 [Actinomycetes bacterium KLBMP 9797]
MGREIIHQPRLAFDGARGFVAGVECDGVYPWLRRRVAELLGPAYGEALADSRRLVLALERDDAPLVEAAKWRVRLEDALRRRPELAPDLLALAADLAFRMTAPRNAAGRG